MSADLGTFGGRLRHLREAAGLTQEELAARAGLTAKGIAALERGRRQRPYPHTVDALATALDLDEAGREALVRGGTLPGQAPPPAPPPAARPLIVAPPTSLIGREEEIAAIGALFAAGAGGEAEGETRLVTLTGPGGVGKTRLALAVAQRAEADFPEGVVFVPLAPIAEPALVLSAIVGALGLREVGGQAALAILQAHLAARRLLLVLDNFEHLLDAAPAVAALLAAAPGLAILATSRAPLRLRGEREWAVAPLPLPALDRLPSVAAIADNPAVRLFVARARDVAPEFALTQAEAAAIAAICRRLDGLPLALELAAARTRILRPTELLARLDRALPLLTGGARDLPARQRTMRDTIAWSHDLLGDDERRLFRRLAVFAGGWTLDAAEALVEPHEDALGTLAALLEQSLIAVREEDGGDPALTGSRYRMLEPLREYAREQLEASGEADELRGRHARYYLALAERGGAALAGPEQLPWLARLEREHDNVRAAMSWALATGRREIAIGLGWALQIFWATRGYSREGRAWMAEVLAGGPLPPREEARALAVAGMMARIQGDYAVAIERLAAAAERFRALDDSVALLPTLSRLGHAARLGGDYDRAEAISAEGLALARARDDRVMIVWFIDVLSAIALARADFARAAAYAAEGLPLALANDDIRYVAGMHFDTAQAALGLGDIARVGQHAGQGLVIARQTGLRRTIAIGLDLLASVAVWGGDGRRAALLYGVAEATRDADGLAPWSSTDHAIYGPSLASLRDRLAPATLAATWAAGRALPLERAVAYALGENGEDDLPLPM